ncbi:hypothetical protein EYR40_002132 [Pleurotus pulmonarius]|nr:hypothetical protein EYR36_011462 [Pleurotus pulmonarius]KAF4585295.1 hypothetical protein EYR40_002132 [Pleurotus pulmonarius]
MELHTHLLRLPTPLSPYSYAAITPIAFVSLNRADIPTKAEPDMRPAPNAVKRAFLSLEVLAQCVRMVDYGQAPAMEIAAHILRKHDSVFPWVHFIQRCYFGQEPGSTVDPIVSSYRTSAIFILTFVFTSLAQVREKLSYAKHPLFTETVIDVWRKIIHLNLEASTTFLGSLCAHTDTILAHFFNKGKPSQPIIHLCGGQAAIVALFLAHIERDVERITTPSNEVPFVKIRSSFPYFLSFLSNPPFLSELLAQRAITRIAGVVKRMQRKCASYTSSNEVTNPAVLSSMALKMFCAFTGFADIPAVDEILHSGILRALRKSSWGAIEPDDLELITSCVMAYTVYPAIIERATKVARLPAPSSHQPIPRRLWRDYDTFVSTRGLLWETAGEMARRVNGICSSVGFAPFLDLFACHC